MGQKDGCRRPSMSLWNGLKPPIALSMPEVGKAFGAYNGKTGDAVWLNKGWPQGEATTSTPLLANGVVISGANWRGFYGNDAQTGELLWKLDKDGITDRGAHRHMTVICFMLLRANLYLSSTAIRGKSLSVKSYHSMSKSIRPRWSRIN